MSNNSETQTVEAQAVETQAVETNEVNDETTNDAKETLERLTNIINKTIEDVTESSSATKSNTVPANIVEESSVNDTEEDEQLEETVQVLDELEISREMAGMIFFAMEIARIGVISEDVAFNALRQFYQLDTDKPLRPNQVQAFLTHKFITEYVTRISPVVKKRTEIREKLKFENIEKNIREKGGRFMDDPVETNILEDTVGDTAGETPTGTPAETAAETEPAL